MKGELATWSGNTGDLSPQDIEFCKWYSGSKVQSDGSASELDPYTSALNAGIPPLQAERMGERLRTDPMLQLQVSVFNRARRGETLAKIDSYGRRALDIAMNLAETAENEGVQLGAVKILLNAAGLNESQETRDERAAQLKTRDEFNSRLNDIASVLKQQTPAYTKFGGGDIIDAEVVVTSGGEVTLEDGEDEDPLVE